MKDVIVVEAVCDCPFYYELDGFTLASGTGWLGNDNCIRV